MDTYLCIYYVEWSNRGVRISIPNFIVLQALDEGKGIVVKVTKGGWLHEVKELWSQIGPLFCHTTCTCNYSFTFFFASLYLPFLNRWIYLIKLLKICVDLLFLEWVNVVFKSLMNVNDMLSIVRFVIITQEHNHETIFN